MPSELSPAESYKAFRSLAGLPVLNEFAGMLSYPMDPFQVTSCVALEQQKSVLVAAPTGAGKTVIGEFAIHLSLSKQQKVFYTTPIKALSNQKYQELCNRYGDERVGILTGDNNINSDAPIVVMTTEVLRNMIYTGSMNLMNLGFVIMDEVHYLADRARGAVWEEVILHLPKDVKLVSLSATVSNAEEFGAWLQEVRGDTEIIVSEVRPVPLTQHVLFGTELLDLFSTKSKDQVVNPELVTKHHAKTRTAQMRNPRAGKFRGNYRNEPKLPKLDKPETIELLQDANLLPAIFFIFSRKACDSAVKACQHSNLKLTTPDDRAAIREIIESRTADIEDEDLETLGFYEWSQGLERGVAAHHAGMLPVFKEIVEELFLRRLVKVVFATETLALGINMPARTVVLDRLDKFNGEGRVQITPGEYTQLTGRAGRRGIDTEGHSVIQWSGNLEPASVAGLASKRTYPLISSFRPTFNMAVNLVNAFSRERSRQVLETSFAQFQADRSVVHLARSIREKEISISGYEQAMECHLGDFFSFAELRRQISDIEKQLADSRPRGNRGRDLRGVDSRSKLEKDLANLKNEIKRHPCNRCPEREQHSRWGERYWKLRREIDSVVDQIESRTNQVAKTFDRICSVLIEFEYLREHEGGELEVLKAGEKLATIYGDRDFLVSEIVRRGTWDEADAATLAALTTALVFEQRREEDEEYPRLPKGNFKELLLASEDVLDEINTAMKRHRLKLISQLDPSASYAMHRWTNGGSLNSVLYEGGFLIGDFIRLCKQVIDLLEQIGRVSEGSLAVSAAKAIEQIKRGIVAYSYYA